MGGAGSEAPTGCIMPAAASRQSKCGVWDPSQLHHLVRSPLIVQQREKYFPAVLSWYGNKILGRTKKCRAGLQLCHGCHWLAAASVEGREADAWSDESFASLLTACGYAHALSRQAKGANRSAYQYASEKERPL